MKRLLITGGSGFLGGNLAKAAAPAWETYVARNARTIHQTGLTVVGPLDVTRPADVSALVRDVAPDAIIHAAGLASLDACAADPELARRINVEGTENIALAAHDAGARLVFVSTDLVFDGTRGNYAEDDRAVPVSTYGRTKREGEQRALRTASNCCVVRSSVMYGWSRNSSRCFLETMLANLSAGSPVRVFSDEFRMPVYVTNLCDVLLEFARRADLQRIYHVGGSDRLTRLDLGRMLCDAFDLPYDLLIPVRQQDVPSREPRPQDCTLRTDKARSVLATPIWSTREALRHMRQERPSRAAMPRERTSGFPA